MLSIVIRRTLLVTLTACAAIAGWVVVSSHLRHLAARAEPSPIEITSSPLSSFKRGEPGQDRFGRLRFLGGLVLKSNSPRFGGWSGIAIDRDGRHFLAISDIGSWLTGEIIYSGARPTGIANARIGPIPGVGGRPLEDKREADAEAVTLLDGTLSKGTALVAYERSVRIGRYPVSADGLGAPLGSLTLPPAASRMRNNSQFESVAVLKGGSHAGSVIAFAEEPFDGGRNRTGWLWPGGINGRPQAFSLVNKGDFAITDAAALPDGGLIVLERWFRWSEGLRMRLRRVDATSVKSGAVIDGEVLLDADTAFEIDNMEGLSVHRNAGGQTILTVISDDNFNPLLQRTILLQFALDETRRRAASVPR
ncbi:MAG: esterase-like activity of phytase family protein [Hyphomicrobiaceae bacterium]